VGDARATVRSHVWEMVVMTRSAVSSSAMELSFRTS
jgi:hypothetical protein